MTGILLPLPRLGYTPAANAKIFFWQPGTTNKQNAYTDKTLATPLSNPLSANAAGLFDAIYLDPNLGYDVAVYASTETNDPPTGTPIFSQQNTYLPAMALPQVLSKSGNYTVTTADGFDVLVLVDATAGAVTIAPYTAVGNTGKKITVKKIDSSANAVTIDPNGAQTIDGATTKVLSTQYDSLTIESDGANWQLWSKPSKVLQIVTATYATETTNNTSTYADTGLTASITPSSITSKVLVVVFQNGCYKETNNTWLSLRLLRGATQLAQLETEAGFTSSVAANYMGSIGGTYLDAPASVAAQTYKTTFASGNNAAVAGVQNASALSTICLMEVTP